MFKRRSEKGNSINLEYLTCSINDGVIPQSQYNGATKLREGTDLNSMRTIHSGDYIISLMSFQGGFMYSTVEGVTSSAYKVFYPISTSINREYFKHVFKSQWFIDWCQSVAIGIRNGRQIDYKSFEQLSLPIPPLSEQQAIADHLDNMVEKIDSEIKSLESLIQQVKDYKSSKIYEMVTGK